MAAHSSVLAWRIPGTGEPGGLLSMGSHRVRHDWSDFAAAAIHYQVWCLLWILYWYSLAGGRSFLLFLVKDYPMCGCWIRWACVSYPSVWALPPVPSDSPGYGKESSSSGFSRRLQDQAGLSVPSPLACHAHSDVGFCECLTLMLAQCVF